MIWGGTPPNWQVFIKDCIFILICLNFSHLQSTLHLMQYTYLRHFFHCSNSFWTCQFWYLLVLLPFFSPLPHRQNVSLWGLFSSRETKTSHLGWDWVNREGGAWGSCCSGSKTAGHSAQCGQVDSHKSPIMKWASVLKESSKRIHWSQTHPLTTVPAGTLIQMGS